MRIGVFVAVLIAFAQPAFAKQNSHRHHAARTHQVQQSTATQTFVRTDAIDTPLFGDPAGPARAFVRAAAQVAGVVPMPRVRSAPVRTTSLDAAIARHAAANGLPVELVHRVVIRESRYNPAARNGPNLGLMQIQYRTARGVGYTGSAAGLMDAETNLTYAVRYLAGAWRAAGGNPRRAVAYYASGYHGRGVRQPAQRAVVRSGPTGTQTRQVALRQPGVILVRGDAMQ